MIKTVIKRGNHERVPFDEAKIEKRLRRLAEGNANVDIARLVRLVVASVTNGMTTSSIDTLAAETAAGLIPVHHAYGTFAARIFISNLHKETPSTFSACVEALHIHFNPETHRHSPLVTDELLAITRRNAERLNDAICHENDQALDYFGVRTLAHSYLLKTAKGAIMERPQYMWMRVALGIHGEDIDAALETYQALSNLEITHATPTLFNAGTPNGQLASCFLLTMKDDSIEGIYDTLKNCAIISKNSGGIGLSIHNIRAQGSYISGSGGRSNGIVPMLRNFDSTAHYVDQGGGKRRGAIAIYLEPWHADIESFLELKRGVGNDYERARSLFYALWTPDLFFKRVQADGPWSLFCPNEAPGLADCYGAEFEALYTRYETEGKARRTIRAAELWHTIIERQIELGLPYVLAKDACNSRSNHRHLGTIKSSNLCTEIIQYSSPDEIAVCNLASVNLRVFADATTKLYDFAKLRSTVRMLVRNLNRVIDRTHYPLPETRKSNLRHRPMGIGVQGLADAFLVLEMPFDSQRARKLNRNIFECMYYAALEESCTLAAMHGPYESYQGSPASRGELQFDYAPKAVTDPSLELDWGKLRARIAAHGLRNSLLLAPMPTASTAQIAGNNACVEPYDSNIFTRNVLAGNFCVVNRHLVDRLEAMGKWTSTTLLDIFRNDGSIQKIAGIDDGTKLLFRTAWELKQRALVEMAADRVWFIDQSHSFNLFMANATIEKVGAAMMLGWRLGLKTLVYYLHTKPARLGNALPALTQLQRDVDDSSSSAAAASSTSAAAVKRTRVSEKEQTSVIAYTADWCKSCKVELPLLQEECRKRNIAIMLFDMDEPPVSDGDNDDMPTQIPTFVLIRNGVQKGRTSGAAATAKLMAMFDNDNENEKDQKDDEQDKRAAGMKVECFGCG